MVNSFTFFSRDIARNRMKRVLNCLKLITRNNGCGR